MEPEHDRAADRQTILSQAEQLAAEQAQLAILLNEGAKFTTPSRSWLRFIGPKQRTWNLQQPYLGTLDYLAQEMIQLDFSEEAIASDGQRERRRLTKEHARRCCRIIAIALLNSHWAIKLLTKPLSRYLLWRINPDYLLGLVALINHQSNLESFTTSIKLMSLTPRKTQPALIEKTGDSLPDELPD